MKLVGMAYTVRPALASDSRFIYSLSTDPRIRAASTNPDGFSFEDHERWYADKLAHPETHRIWIMEVGLPIGQVRYAKDGARADVSISIVPHHWHQGYAAALLQETMPLARELLGADLLVALVLRHNYASRRLFRKAGFRFVGAECRMNRVHARYEA